MTDKKPERTLELHVDIDAPIEAAWKAITEGPGIANWFAPIAEVSAPGEGATVKAGWSEEMMMTSTVVAWEPQKHVRWLDESGWMGPGTSMAVDYCLSTENGKTRVRLVQSAFGASDGWDDLCDGMKTGDSIELKLSEPATLRAVVEVLIEGQGLGLRIAESPIIFIERREGQSKLSGRVLVESVVAPWRLRWRSLPGKSPRANV